MSADFNAYTELSAGDKLPTITLSMSEEFEEAKRKYPHIDWNEVLKRGIIRRLAELKKFEELRERGKL